MVTNSDLRWYNLAMKIAADGLYIRDLHGAVIVRAGSVLSVGTNRSAISHPVSNLYLKCSLHAEQRALLRCADPAGAILYSARLHKNLCSKPCNMCYALVMLRGARAIVYHNGEELVREKLP